MRAMALLLAVLALMVAPNAYARSYRCVFGNETPQVVHVITPTDQTHVTVAYAGGQSVPYLTSGSGDERHWISNHRTPVTYDFDPRHALLRAGVPINNAAGLANDARPNLRAIVPGSGPQNLNVLRVVRVATCAVQ